MGYKGLIEKTGENIASRERYANNKQHNNYYIVTIWGTLFKWLLAWKFTNPMDNE